MLIFFPARKSFVWFVLYLVNVIVTLVFDGMFARGGHQVTEKLRTIFFVMNTSVSSLMLFAFAGYFVDSAKRQRQQAEALLLNILPKMIAPVLKSGQKTIADHYDSASVLFADLVRWTPSLC